MKNEKQTSNLNFNVQLFRKSENHLFWCFLSQLQYRHENQNFISNFIFQFIKKNEMALSVHGLSTKGVQPREVHQCYEKILITGSLVNLVIKFS